MKQGIILVLILLTAIINQAQEKVKDRVKCIREIVERNGGVNTNEKDWEKAELEYQKIHREKIRLLSYEFLEGRDTLYLLADLQNDTMQYYKQKEEVLVWQLFDPRPSLDSISEAEGGPICIFGLEIYHQRDFMLKNKLVKRIQLTDDQLKALRPASRSELVKFYTLEDQRINHKWGYPAWGTWNLLDYFYKVYILLPKGNSVYELYDLYKK